ncbi:MAG TPA: protein kinase [Pyrinomonadaceae bacterium]|jgi:serine/threonine-protein kinase
MRFKDWERIEELFHTAVALPAEERAGHLDRVCSGNAALRAEVESLLAALDDHPEFMEQPVLSLGMRILSEDTHEKSLVGETVGPYHIIRLLGWGGMGEVYLADDKLLGRKVALKFLARKFVDDQWAKRQLMKEAQAVAQLYHPNICAVHGFEEHAGHSFIVMQYIEGETLDCLLKAGLLGIDQKLFLARQIANALTEAHAHGIIHRDIKPQNIMVTAAQQAMMLDFGLAKVVQQKQGLSGMEVRHPETSQLGFIPGTVAYMSPEQLRGERLDYRSDVFSFGTVLYEMIAGENPYHKESKAEIISAVLNDRPRPLREIAPGVPIELESIIQKCLEKNEENRYPSASEILYDLENLEAVINNDGRRFKFSILGTVSTAVITLLLIALSAFIYLRLTRVPTIAVLPIVNASDDASIEYLGDGLSESLINKLSGLSYLRVKPLTSVSGYKGKVTDVQAVGRDLNVDAVLAGKIIRQGESLVLEAALVNTSEGTQMWGARYGITMTEIFAMQEDISENIASNLKLRLLGHRKNPQAGRGTENPEAFRQYMLGRYYWKYRDKDNIRKAVEHFNTAIKLDPLYARAYAGLADCYVLLNMVSYGHTETKEAMTRAEAAAKQALDIDDTLPEAHTSLGVVNVRYRWNWPEAEKEFKRAIELNPDYAAAHYGYSNLLAILGRQQESIHQSEAAKDLDPFSPAVFMNYCRSFYYARRYDQALDCFGNLIAEYPSYTNGEYARGYVYLQKGMYQDATRIFEKIYAADKSLAGAALGYTYGVTGRRPDALRVLSDMTVLSRQTYIPPQEFALIHLGLDDLDNAFAWLQKALEEHFASLVYLPVDPLFGKLHADPRFIILRQRLGLPAPQGE